MCLCFCTFNTFSRWKNDHSAVNTDVTVWCHSVMSQCDVMVWCHGVMSQCDVTVWCHSVMSQCDVTVWCHSVMSADTMTSSTCRLVHYKSHVQGLILALKKHNQDRRSRCFHGSSSAGDGGTTGGNDADGGGEEGEAGETETEVKCATLICKVTVTNCSSSSHRALPGSSQTQTLR